MNSGSTLSPPVLSKPVPRSPPLFSLASKPTGTSLPAHERSPGGIKPAAGKPNAIFNKFSGVGTNTKSEGEHDASESELFVDAPPKPVVWHPQQEKLLKQWGEMASSNRWMHFNTHLMYVKLTMWFTLPVIILSSLTGTMNFAQSSFPVKYHSMLPLIIGGVNLITGMITTIGSFLRVSELAEGNRVAALSYGKIASSIRVELLLPLTQRTMNGSDFIATCRAEMDRLTEQTPDIPRAIERKFHASFKAMLSKGDDSFYTPDILTLRPVEIYKDKPISTIQVGEVVATAADIFRKRVAERKQAAQIQEQQTVIEVLQHQHADHIQKEKEYVQQSKEVGTRTRPSGGNWAFVGSTAGSTGGSTASRRPVNTGRERHQEASLPTFPDADQTSNGSSAPKDGDAHPTHTAAAAAMMRHTVPRLPVSTDFRIARQRELDELRQRGFVRKDVQQRHHTHSGADPSPPEPKGDIMVDTSAKSVLPTLLVHVAPDLVTSDSIVQFDHAATAVVSQTAAGSAQQEQLDKLVVSTTHAPAVGSESPDIETVEPGTQLDNLFSVV